MEFRVAEYADFQGVAQLHAESWQTAYKGIMRQSYLDETVLEDKQLIWQTRLLNPPFSQHVLVAEEEGKLLGFICLFGNHNVDYGTIIDNLHVTPEAQRRGIAKQLIIQAVEWAEKFYPDNGVFLEVLADNANAIKFYESLGGKRELKQRMESPCGKYLDEYLYTWKRPAELSEGCGVLA
ncbi:histone acetyltransferase HPA2 and related acetyltransferases [Vibrio variabilis]|uniref:Histone acetyltransferase HPA2 and related acetyltransferases n=1 Tax=Vibrio variabilis TaxID=990271 RepID=A0ABQ0JNC1_9VIBR|nr:histone acetyltransferase HPA2 and related acetyltransferases [Vibrio variabilis]